MRLAVVAQARFGQLAGVADDRQERDARQGADELRGQRDQFPRRYGCNGFAHLNNQGIAGMIPDLTRMTAPKATITVHQSFEIAFIYMLPRWSIRIRKFALRTTWSRRDRCSPLRWPRAALPGRRGAKPAPSRALRLGLENQPGGARPRRLC